MCYRHNVKYYFQCSLSIISIYASLLPIQSHTIEPSSRGVTELDEYLFGCEAALLENCDNFINKS
jgi:hypothetical protein